MRRTDTAFLVATAGSLAVLAVGALPRRIELIGDDDLSTFWAGARALVLGHDPYDAATWIPTALALGTQLPATPVYGYPPWVAVALAPLAMVPLPAASILWLVASLVAAIAAVGIAVRALLPERPRDHAVALVALLLSWAGMLTLVLGQWGHLLVAALLTAVLALGRGRPVLAGVAAAAMMAKPQLFLFAAPALAAHALWPAHPGGPPPRAGRTAALVAGGIAAALIAAAWIALPSWWPTYPKIVGEQQTRPYTESLHALFATVGGPDAVVLAPVVLIAIVLVGLRAHPRSAAWLPLWLTISIAGAPYINVYDHVLLIVPIVLAAGALHGRSRGRSRAVLWTGCAILLVGTPLIYEVELMKVGSFGAILPLAVLALLAVALWPYRSAVATPVELPAPRRR